MSGFGAIASMNIMLRNNEKLRNKRHKPLEAIEHYHSTHVKPALEYKKATKKELRLLRDRLKRKGEIRRVKLFFALMVSLGITYGLFRLVEYVLLSH